MRRGDKGREREIEQERQRGERERGECISLSIPSIFVTALLQLYDYLATDNGAYLYTIQIVFSH